MMSTHMRWPARRALLLALLAAAPASAQFPIPGKIKEKIKQKIEQKEDSLANAITCAITDQDCIDKAKASGKKVKIDSTAKAAPAGKQKEQGGEVVAPAGSDIWANYDFVPGEKVIFAEDYAADRVGNFPRRYEFVAGNGEIVTWNNSRWLRANSYLTFAIPLPQTLPERFTMEFPITLPWWGMMVYGGPDGEPQSLGSHKFSTIVINCCEVGVKNAGGEGGSWTDARSQFPDVDEIDGHPFTVRVQGDGGYLKVYLNEKRLANIPNAAFKRSNKIYFEMRPGKQPVMLGPISINAGGQSMYDAIVATGRFATQGILFDFGSDRLRGESTPTLSEIGDMLKAHADLKLRIEGHTDNVGDAAANQSLSERRAAAVKAYLVSKFGIDAARLESQGFGATKPVSSNETAEGRQNNRRVELVKLP